MIIDPDICYSVIYRIFLTFCIWNYTATTCHCPRPAIIYSLVEVPPLLIVKCVINVDL